MELRLLKEPPAKYFPTSYLQMMHFPGSDNGVLVQKWRSQSAKGSLPDVWVMVPTFVAEKEAHE